MTKRIVFLDGIRIVSSIVVCIAHSFQIFLLPKLGSTHIVYSLSTQAASYSVVIFFMLSGYMITNSIFNNITKNQFFNFGKFWEDRLLRLYPPLIFSIILSFVIFKTIHCFHLNGAISFRLPGDLDLGRESVQYSWKEIIVSFFFLQGLSDFGMNMNAPLWSLGDEFFLYLVASFFAHFIFNKKRILSFVLILVFSIIIYTTGHWKTALYLYFMWGIGAFFSIEKIKFNNIVSMKFNLFICFASFVTLLMALIILNFKIPNINYSLPSFLVIQCSFLLFFIYLFRSISVKLRESIIRIIEKLTPEKDFTYTLYIIHFPILLFLFSLFHVLLNSSSIVISVLFLLFLIPTIILLSKYLAIYLENKKYVNWIFDFK